MTPGDLDDTDRVLLMVALAGAGDAARETWVDTRLVGLDRETIAVRDGITLGGVSMRVRSCERALARWADRG